MGNACCNSEPQTVTCEDLIRKIVLSFNFKKFSYWEMFKELRKYSIEDFLQVRDFMKILEQFLSIDPEMRLFQVQLFKGYFRVNKCKEVNIYEAILILLPHLNNSDNKKRAFKDVVFYLSQKKYSRTKREIVYFFYYFNAIFFTKMTAFVISADSKLKTKYENILFEMKILLTTIYTEENIKKELQSLFKYETEISIFKNLMKKVINKSMDQEGEEEGKSKETKERSSSISDGKEILEDAEEIKNTEEDVASPEGSSAELASKSFTDEKVVNLKEMKYLKKSYTAENKKSRMKLVFNSKRAEEKAKKAVNAPITNSRVNTNSNTNDINPDNDNSSSNDEPIEDAISEKHEKAEAEICDYSNLGRRSVDIKQVNPMKSSEDEGSSEIKEGEGEGEVNGHIKQRNTVRCETVSPKKSIKMIISELETKKNQNKTRKRLDVAREEKLYNNIILDFFELRKNMVLKYKNFDMEQII